MRMLILILMVWTFAATAEEAKPAPTIDLSAMDRNVDPCHDFYEYACGSWIKRTEIPPDRSAWSRSFLEIAERNLKTEDQMLKTYASGRNTPPSAYPDKLGVYYSVCMDEKKAETASLAALKHALQRIDAPNDLSSLANEIATLQLEGVDALFDFGPFQDFHNSNEMIAAADQGGLTLPDRDYYLSDEGKMPAIRALFVEHVAKMLELLSEKPETAKVNAATILRIETALAKASMSRVDRRDPTRIYHRTDKKGLAEKAPKFPWKEFFKTLGFPKIEAINVAVPEFFAGLNNLLETTSLADLKTYLKWHTLDAAAPTLGHAFVDENFRFRSAAFTGEKKLKPRWKRCVAATEAAMGQALGHSFIQATFGATGKEDSKDIMRRIEDALSADFAELSWMDEKTRKAALEKLSRVFNQIGYPNKWRDYTGMQVTKQSFLENFFSTNRYNAEYQLDRIGRPVDHEEWDMPPQMVNAYYSAEDNKMVFPAGILQVPFFNAAAALPMNYGAIGMVMGHELTHGFDDEGRRFDATGDMRDWWTESSAKAFSERAECFVKQYDAYDIIEKIHVNGKLTLGENIADNGGIKLAYSAFKSATSDIALPKVEGFTPDQQFFLSFAQAWCTKQRPELQRMLATIDPHSPARYRVNGPLSNFSSFAAAFRCEKGQPMARKDACSMW